MRSSKSLTIVSVLLVMTLAGLVAIVKISRSDAFAPSPIPLLDLSKTTPVGVSPVNQNDPLDRGKWAYNTFCAHCHGYSGEGEGPNVDTTLPDALGYMPVPRHDSKGHTWMHAD